MCRSQDTPRIPVTAATQMHGVMVPTENFPAPRYHLATSNRCDANHAKTLLLPPQLLDKRIFSTKLLDIKNAKNESYEAKKSGDFDSTLQLLLAAGR